MMDDIAELREEVHRIDREVVTLQGETKSLYRRHENTDNGMKVLEEEFKTHKEQMLEMQNRIMGSLLTLKIMIPAAAGVIAWLISIKL